MIGKTINLLNSGSRSFFRAILTNKYFILPYVIAFSSFLLIERESVVNKFARKDVQKGYILDELEKFNLSNSLLGLKIGELGFNLDETRIITELETGIPLNFELYKYRLPADFIKSSSYQKAKLFSKNLENTLSQRERRGWRDIINNSTIKYDDKQIELKSKIYIDPIFEFIDRVKSKLNNLKPTIYIKGYADGSKIKGWSKKLEPSHLYDTVAYLPKLRDRDEVDFDYFYEENKKENIKFQILSDSLYKNEHLPNLRAHYVKTELILPQLQLKGLEEQIDVVILEGKEISRAIQKNDLRFVDLYIEFDW